MLNAASPHLSGLAQIIADAGLLSAERVSTAQQVARQRMMPLAAYLVSQGLLRADQLRDACHLAIPLSQLDLDEFDASRLPRELFNNTLLQLVERHQVLPLYRQGRRLYLATADPTNFSAFEEQRLNTGLQVEPLLVEQDKLSRLIDELLGGEGHVDFDSMLNGDLPDLSLDLDTDEASDTPALITDEDNDAPIVSFINRLLLDAIRRGASDLHFEPYEKSYRIRFRIDGILHEAAQAPVQLSLRLAARLKVMSKLDIAERRTPQDGRVKIHLSQKRAIDFRVSTLPTMWGEKIVMRILDATSASLGIDKLGYEPEQEQLYRSNLASPQGMILVTGPTGSGKTVSLYTGLNLLNTTERNISTAEDPVEINLPGINQVQINTKAGLTFAGALRSFLRQDPDVVMVGEIRDLETAEIAIKAAQTGHLVLSTLHTNSAAETITRLLNMGVAGYNLASSVNLIIAQRLVRRLCNHCKQPEHLPNDELRRLGFNQAQIDQGLQLFRAVGCNECASGYRGRIGVYEVMPMTPSLSNLIMNGANALELAAQARQEGVDSLRSSGLRKVAAGITSISEVCRITQD